MIVSSPVLRRQCACWRSVSKPVPLFWSFGSANAMPAIMTHGGCMVLQEAFEPGAALALIERDFGADLSQRIARRLVVFMRRNGDQRQYSQALRLQDRLAAPFRDLVEKIEAQLSARWSVDDMADACQMSRRTFQRKFAAHFGVAPTEVLKRLRLERAQALAASGKVSRKEMAQLAQTLNG